MARLLVVNGNWMGSKIIISLDKWLYLFNVTNSDDEMSGLQKRKRTMQAQPAQSTTIISSNSKSENYSNSVAPLQHLFTCISCQIGFPTPEGQRNHMKSDW